MGRSLRSVIALAALLALVPATAVAAPGDTARYILPPGNYGGLPFTDELDRPAAALRRAHAAARQRHARPTSTGSSCPRTSSRSARPRGATPAGPALRLVYDAYGVPHVYGKTRADVAFGAGWTTARDRAAADPARPLPGARGGGRRARHRRLRRSSPARRRFVPSPQAEALVTKQRKLIVKTLRREGPPDHRATRRPTPTASTPTRRPPATRSRRPRSTT